VAILEAAILEAAIRIAAYFFQGGRLKSKIGTVFFY